MALTSSIVRLRNFYRRTSSRYCARRLVHVAPLEPIISFTFDDFPRSALHEGGEILRQHGCVGTYYVALGLMDKPIPAGIGFNAGDLSQVVADGHELGCHTFDHCHSWETAPRIFEESIVRNQAVLNQMHPRAAFKSLSYPISCPRPQTKRLASRHFYCCRGGGESFNLGPTDAGNLQAIFLEKNREHPEAMRDLIDRNARARGWLIFATHDVCPNPTSFGCTPGFFRDIVAYAAKSGSRVLPVGKAWEAIQISKTRRA